MTLDEYRATLPALASARFYAPYGENHDHIRIGAYFYVQRTDGKVAVVDPLRPWNDATVEVITRERAQYLQDVAEGRHPGAFST
jgi:hypothetical protein